MNFKEIAFDKEKVSVRYKISKEAISGVKFESWTADIDTIRDEMSLKLTGYIYSNMAEERDLCYDCPRPTFLDWLLQRRKKATFNLKVKDLLLNAPKVADKTTRIYVVEKSE